MMTGVMRTALLLFCCNPLNFISMCMCVIVCLWSISDLVPIDLSCGPISTTFSELMSYGTGMNELLTFRSDHITRMKVKNLNCNLSRSQVQAPGL